MSTPTNGSEPAKTVLLIGGTGHLGGLIARALLERGADLRLLIRSGSAAKLAPEIAEAAEIVEDETRAFDGVYTVVSAVQGGPDVIVDAQRRWLQAAREAGVRRFIPSDYSMDLFNLAEGENVSSDDRRAFGRVAEEERGDVEVVHVLVGAFLDRRVVYGFLGAIDAGKGEAYLWGDGDEKMDVTTYEDTAAYTAEAALDDRPVPAMLYVAGETPTFHELVRETEAGLGRPIKVVQLGTLAELDAELARRREAEPRNVYAWLPLMYWRAMLSGKGKLGTLLNERYPNVQTTGVRAYAERMAAGTTPASPEA